jgi:hypothetical protein
MLNMPLSLFSTVCLSRIFAFSFANGVSFLNWARFLFSH